MKCEACEHDNLEGARFCANCGAVLPSEAKQENSLVGHTIGGRFRIVKVLGEGGMGVVYEGEQQMGSTVRKVAVKTLHHHLSQDPSVAARFHRECGTVAQLEHPNTIKVYDFGATPDGTLYIAMEFVAGKSLQALIQECTTLPPPRVLNIVRQITGSLAEAHNLGIVHRDLKPENVVLTERAGETDVVKLLDFGIAARTESADAAREAKLTQQGMVLGTPPYMSPEQFTGKALDARSDIYSLGVMVYEMLTGRLPFEATTPWQWATEHMTSQPIPFEATPVASQIPESMRAAVMRALTKDRDQRQATVGDFYKELAGEGRASMPSAHSGTAAMEAAPDFTAGGVSATAKTAAMPAGGGGMPGGMPAGAISPAVPAPPPRQARGGGKGLVIGLASVGGVLLIGIVIALAQSMKGNDDPQPPLADLNTSPPTASTIAPEIETSEPTPTAAPEEPDEEPEEKDTKPASTGTTPKTSATTTKPPTTPKTTPTTQKPPATSTPPPSSAAACSQCISAARSGNIQGAAQYYAQCSDAGQKAQCKQVANQSATAAARNAGKGGDCNRARAIVAAASQMGVANKRMTTELAQNCK